MNEITSAFKELNVLRLFLRPSLVQKQSHRSYMTRGVLHPIFGCPRMHLLFCPEMPSEAISEHLFSKYLMGEHSPRPPYSCMLMQITHPCNPPSKNPLTPDTLSCIVLTQIGEASKNRYADDQYIVSYSTVKESQPPSAFCD